MILPKINNCEKTSYIFYLIVASFLTAIYNFGGFQQTIYKLKN